MSEIPMPASEPYQPQRQPSGGYGTCCKIAAVVCVVLIIAMVLIAMVFMGGLLSIFGGITGITPSYGERSIASENNKNVAIFNPNGTFYYGEFDVYSSEVQTATQPDVHFDISVDDTGSDAVSVTVHFAIYEIDQTTFDSLSWASLDSYLVEDGDYSTSITSFYNINNYASTYVWVIWFDAASKADVWTVDIDLTLRYNW